MLFETGAWIVLLLGVCGYGLLWVSPSTRPYAKKYWWVAVMVAVTALGFILARGYLGRPDNGEAKREGEDIQKQTTGAMDAIVDKAREEMARSDAELAVSRAASQAERVELQAQLDAVAVVDDSLERRKALIAIGKQS
jgi:hypothetical protein